MKGDFPNIADTYVAELNIINAIFGTFTFDRDNVFSNCMPPIGLFIEKNGGGCQGKFKGARETVVAWRKGERQ
jgi:hypothetical protein